MTFLIAVGISVGILAGLWAGVSVTYGLITFVGFLSWASFYAAGGKTKGLKDSLILNFSGVVWGFLIVQMAGIFGPILGATIGLSVAVVIGAGAMCWQAHLPLLGFIPGAFIGCSAYFATNFDFKGTVIALIAGAVLGYISEQGGIRIHKVFGKK
ncbi:MAG TPA: DUF1097 domain-containing protein [Erysipelotrichaceae bacterium]|nr:DUF1097 domain-containing protein [Erysipelotrichaceae bacterium]HAO61193.1 DUF1097 domain-containing protein [Erysipelotrichaceae bacterium]